MVRGLFTAEQAGQEPLTKPTGEIFSLKPKFNSKLLESYGGVKKNSDSRKKNDFYPTPPIATYSLLRVLEESDQIFHRERKLHILEPCSGEGWISKELEINGHHVESYDLNVYDKLLVDTKFGEDFLISEKKDPYMLVTNPPYANNFPEKMVEKACKEYPIVCLFLRITFLESKTRYNLFKKYRPKWIFSFSDRINNDFTKDLLKKQNGGLVNYAWFVWKHDWKEDYSMIKQIYTKEYWNDWLNNSAKHYFDENGNIRYGGKPL